MWFDDDKGESRRRSYNRRKYDGPAPILQVNARMVEQRKDRMHRVGGMVLLTLCIALALWLTMMGARVLGEVFFSGNELFAVRHLDLSSDGKLKPEHIREYASLQEGMNLFAVDLLRVREDLESVPVVSNVEVTRKLPDTLIVKIVERIPIARLGQNQGGYHLAVDREGYVLGPSSLSPGLPAILGVKEKGLRPGSRLLDDAVLDALEALDTCETAHISQVVKIKTIDVDQAEYLDLRLSDGERVLMSRTELENKLYKLVRIIEESQQRGQKIASIDMTVDKNFPVQYR